MSADRTGIPETTLRATKPGTEYPRFRVFVCSECLNKVIVRNIAGTATRRFCRACADRRSLDRYDTYCGAIGEGDG